MDFIVQVSKEIRFFINPAVSVLRVEMTDMDFIGIIPDYNQQTYTDHIEYPELKVVIGQS